MQPSTPRFQEWLAAEKDASEAERELHRQMLNAARGRCVPDADLVQSVHAKRATAQCLFHEAMQELKTLAESLHHRRINTRSTSSRAEGDQQH